MSVRIPPCHHHHHHHSILITNTQFSFFNTKSRPQSFVQFSVNNRSSDTNTSQNNSRKLVLKVKEKLEKDHYSLPTGKNGRDDEELILWFLKDRRFEVEEAISKLTKAIKWRQDFRVSELTEESVRRVAATGKSYVHDSLDIQGRPVLIVVPSKHTPEVKFITRVDPVTYKWRIWIMFFLYHLKWENANMKAKNSWCMLLKIVMIHLFCKNETFMTLYELRQMFDLSEDERLCVFLLEKALTKLPDGKDEILGIFDLRGFGLKNSDLKFLTFLFDVLYYYYPRRLGQVLFVDAPFVFQPIWQLAKPVVKSYASLVRFCSAEDVRKEYFTESTLPESFRH